MIYCSCLYAAANVIIASHRGPLIPQQHMPASDEISSFCLYRDCRAVSFLTVLRIIFFFFLRFLLFLMAKIFYWTNPTCFALTFFLTIFLLFSPFSYWLLYFIGKKTCFALTWQQWVGGDQRDRNQ